MPTEQIHWHRVIHDIANHIGGQNYPTGHLAALRRLDPNQLDSAAFWLLVGRFVPSAFDFPRAAKALAATIRGMAIAQLAHGGRPLGTALAQAGVKELRLLRLLRANDAMLLEEVRRLARLIATKSDSMHVDWVDIFHLLFDKDREKIRQKIAKEYYHQLYHQQNPKGEAA